MFDWKVTMFTYYTDADENECAEYDEFKIGKGGDFATMQDFEKYRDDVMRLFVNGGNTNVRTRCTFESV